VEEARTDQAAINAAHKAALAAPEPVVLAKPEPVEPVQRTDWKWQDDAICKDDGLLFFASDGERPAEKDLRESLAQELCSWCPVRAQCLEYALNWPEKDGFWGGLNEDERKTERRRRQRRSQYDAERQVALPAVPESKRCGCCRIAKPVADFNRNAKRHDGLAGWCRTCTNRARKPTWARDDSKGVA
jgi:WhiB family redox-sensing transcriptional regulator